MTIQNLLFLSEFQNTRNLVLKNRNSVTENLSLKEKLNEMKTDSKYPLMERKLQHASNLFAQSLKQNDTYRYSWVNLYMKKDEKRKKIRNEKELDELLSDLSYYSFTLSPKSKETEKNVTTNQEKELYQSFIENFQAMKESIFTGNYDKYTKSNPNYVKLRNQLGRKETLLCCRFNLQTPNLNEEQKKEILVTKGKLKEMISLHKNLFYGKSFEEQMTMLNQFLEQISLEGTSGYFKMGADRTRELIHNHPIEIGEVDSFLSFLLAKSRFMSALEDENITAYLSQVALTMLVVEWNELGRCTNIKEHLSNKMSPSEVELINASCKKGKVAYQTIAPHLLDSKMIFKPNAKEQLVVPMSDMVENLDILENVVAEKYESFQKVKTK